MAASTLAAMARSINLRDLGGIEVGGGRAVRSGMLFRSAALAELTPEERDALTGLGVRSIVDLRYNNERAQHPTPWEAFGCQSYWAHEHQPAKKGELADLFRDPSFTSETSHRMMVRVYEELPHGHVEALRNLFQTVAKADGPVLFHCTSGKDRTGMSAALLLSALGAPRDAIYNDYLASLNFDVLGSPAFRDLPAERREALQPIFSVHRDYLDAMFSVIETRDGSVDNFLHDVLALKADDLARMRAALLA